MKNAKSAITVIIFAIVMMVVTVASAAVPTHAEEAHPATVIDLVKDGSKTFAVVSYKGTNETFRVSNNYPVEINDIVTIRNNHIVGHSILDDIIYVLFAASCIIGLLYICKVVFKAAVNA